MMTLNFLMTWKSGQYLNIGGEVAPMSGFCKFCAPSVRRGLHFLFASKCCLLRILMYSGL